MATNKKDVEVENTTPNNSTSADKKITSVYVSAGSSVNKQGETLTIVGFGGLKPYEKDGKEIKPGARDAFYKISNIDNFLKAVDADKIGIDIKGKDQNNQDTFMRADAFYQSGIGKNGKAYGFNKICITLQEEERNQANEIIKSAQKLYATKGMNGYSFDKNCDNKLIDKFNAQIQNGCDFTLSAKKDSTLQNYPQLMETVDKIKGGSAMVEIDFVKTQGAVLKSITPIDNSGNLGEQKILKQATQKTTKSKSMS